MPYPTASVPFPTWKAKASSLAGDGEVLAGEAAGPEGGDWNTAIDESLSSVGLGSSGYPIPDPVLSPCSLLVSFKLNDVTEVRDSGPPLGEDGGGVGVDFGEADGSPSGSFKPKVKSSHS